MQVTPVNAAPGLPHNPFLMLRDPDRSEAQDNLQNWAIVLIIVHLLVFAGFLKLAELYHPHLISRADAICLMIRTIEMPGQSNGNGSSSATAGKLLKEHKAMAPSPSTPRSLPVHQLKSAPEPTRISNILPTLNTPRPVWITSEGAQQAQQNAPQADSASASGGITSTRGNEGGTATGQENGTGTGTGNSSGAAGSGAPGGNNIGPYRKHLLIMLSRKWKPSVSPADIILRLRISKAGELLSSEIYQSSGNPKADSEALRAANSVKYPPLPSWFGGKSLIFQIELAFAGARR